MNNDERAAKATNALNDYWSALEMVDSREIELATATLLSHLHHAADVAGFDFARVIYRAERFYYADLEEALKEKHS